MRQMRLFRRHSFRRPTGLLPEYSLRACFVQTFLPEVLGLFLATWDARLVRRGSGPRWRIAGWERLFASFVHFVLGFLFRLGGIGCFALVRLGVICSHKIRTTERAKSYEVAHELSMASWNRLHRCATWSVCVFCWPAPWRCPF